MTQSLSYRCLLLLLEGTLQRHFMRCIVKSFCDNPIEPFLLNGEVLSTTKRKYRRPISWGFRITIELFQAADENAHDS